MKIEQFFCYSLKDSKIIIEIKKVNNFYINNFRHYLNKIEKRDLLLTESFWVNNVKLWNTNNWEYIHHFEEIYRKGELYSACFLIENKNIFIVTCNYFYPWT